jgi:uncharacterized protein
MRRSLAVLLAVVSSAAAADDPPAVPSDCARLTGAAKVVCEEADVAALDRQMADVLPRARAAALPSERGALDEQQRAWVGRREACLHEEEPDACLLFAYQSRLAELRVRYGLVPPPPTETWECGDGSLILAAFYDADAGPKDAKAPPPVVALTRGDRKVVAVLRPSSPGRRYDAPGAISFWIRDKQADVRWAGKQLTCKRPGT